MQVYRYMDIGTAKVTEEEKEGVAEYVKKVKNIEEDILKRGKNIIIIGGTRIICK